MPQIFHLKVTVENDTGPLCQAHQDTFEHGTALLVFNTLETAGLKPREVTAEIINAKQLSA